MKTKKFGTLAIAVIAIVFVVSLISSATIFAATTPALNATTTFGILASTYTNTAGTTINGDIGYTTGPAVTPAVAGTTYVANSFYNQAGTDQGTVLSNLNSQVCTFNFGSPTDLSLQPQPLAPGVYCITAATSIGTGGITLNGAGTYIFRITGALTTVLNSVVSVTGGASACNVFWTPTQATTLGANSSFIGTNIDASGITVGSTATWLGRALAFGGTVTTNTDTITTPSCGSATVASTFVSPSIHITKTASITSSSNPSEVVLFSYAVSNNGTVAMNNVTVSDDKCSPLAYLSGDMNNDAMLDVQEVWNYRCTSNISQTTTNAATATGHAQNFTVVSTASATVVMNTPPVVIAPTPVAPIAIITPQAVATPVIVPKLPKTGFPPQEKYEFLQNLINLFLSYR